MSRAWVLVSTSSKSISVPGIESNFGKDGERLVILLGGSAKKRQGAAIAAAQAAWAAYRRRKGGKEHG